MFDKLKAKIDSHEKFHEMLGSNIGDSTYYNARQGLAGYVGFGSADLQRVTAHTETTWWLLREHLRMHYNVYTTTEVIDKINQSFAGQHALHVSTEDPDMVAYTPTVEYGIADRQLKTTLGKFMRKHLLVYSDATIAMYEASHRAEINGTYEVARTQEEIEFVYQNCAGDTGCMRYPGSHFKLPSGMHPSLVYATPDIGVAYIKDTEGTIKSRSVIYVNPNNPEDKRYVRVYGDRVLNSILKRKGFRCAALTDVPLNTVKLKNDIYGDDVSDTYVMAYMDGPNGDQSHADSQYVALIGGKLTIVSASMGKKLQGLGSRYAQSSKTQAGRITVQEAPSLMYVSALSGIEYSRLDDEPIEYMGIDGTTMLRMSSSEYSRELGLGRFSDWIRAQYITDRGVKQYAIVPKSRTFEDRYNTYVESDQNRKALGYKLESPKWYSGMWGKGLITTDAGDNIYQNDVLRVVRDDNEHAHVYYVTHKAELVNIRKQGYVNCYSQYSQPCVIKKTSPYLRKTDTGKVFDIRMVEDSPYVQLYGTDKFVSRRTAHSVLVFGVTMWMANNDRRNPYEVITAADVDASTQYTGLRAAMLGSLAEGNMAEAVVILSRIIGREAGLYMKIVNNKPYYTSYNPENADYSSLEQYDGYVLELLNSADDYSQNRLKSYENAYYMLRPYFLRMVEKVKLEAVEAAAAAYITPVSAVPADAVPAYVPSVTVTATATSISTGTNIWSSVVVPGTYYTSTAN